MLRRDASSAFDKDYRVDYFKSVTGGWKISEETFITKFILALEQT